MPIDSEGWCLRKAYELLGPQTKVPAWKPWQKRELQRLCWLGHWWGGYQDRNPKEVQQLQRFIRRDLARAYTQQRDSDTQPPWGFAFYDWQAEHLMPAWSSRSVVTTPTKEAAPPTLGSSLFATPSPVVPKERKRGVAPEIRHRLFYSEFKKG